MRNALTVDMEDWYHICGANEYSDPSRWNSYEVRVIRNTDKILGLLRKYNVKATFFVLGYIAQKEPGLIRTVQKEGHEIATHGYYHRRIFEMNEGEFEKDVSESISVISSITKERVIGFRAPEWSVRKETFWAFGILKKLGILYDSSMVPLTRMGSRDFPVYPVKLDTSHGEIWEFPLSTVRFFYERLPFSGGLPLRLSPYFHVVSSIAGLNREGYPAMVYIHPWEFDIEKPAIELPLRRRFMHYFNIETTPRKFEGLLRNFRFAPVRDVLGIVT
jgi:peptidoglycan-N-acetylglucosamine deacetylase